MCKREMLFGSGRRSGNNKELAVRTAEKFSIQPLNNNDLEEINKIHDLLNLDENVRTIAR